MTDEAAARSFLRGEIEALETFDFVAVRPANRPLQIVEVVRREDGALEVNVPGRPSIAPELPEKVRSSLRRARLRERGRSRSA